MKTEGKEHRAQMENLFERFRVEMPVEPEEVNLIGVDFGDGELSAVLARVQDGRISQDPLFPDSTRVGYKCPNVLFLPDAPDQPCKIGIGSFQNGRAYYNFKKCPGTNEARSRYRTEDGTEDTHTYEELMRMAFQQFVRLLFQYNVHTIRRDRRTILAVGRPAGGKWKKREKEYADLLGKGLTVEGYEKEIQVVVVSESLAAFARETNPALSEEKRIRKGETVLLIDCGSSTFDVTLVTEDRIPENGEYSCPFGGNLIEENMLKCFCLGKYPPKEEWPERLLRLRQYSGNSVHKKERMVCTYHKLELRRKKEEFYGPNGNDGTETGMYAVFFEPNPGEDPNEEYESWFLKKAFMGQVLHRMPVSIGSTSLWEKEEPKRTFPSWYAGCRQVFLDAGRQMKQYLKGRVPDKIILTGGVSAMPETAELAEKCFGRRPVRADFPNYSVVEGLAYVAALEVLKNRELKQLQARTAAVIRKCSDSMEKTTAGYLAVCTYQMMSQTLEEWKQEEAASLKSWREDFERKWKTSLDLGEAVREGLTLWYLRDHIEEQINQDIRSHFEKMFPDFAERFSFEIDRKAVEQAFADTEVSLTLPNWKIFGIFGSWRPERVRTVAERVKNREKVKARSEKIIRNLTAIYQNQLGIREKVQERMLEALYPSLKEHVERMTPYFHMVHEERAGGVS